VQRKLNDSNHVLRKGKGKCVLVHVDRMRKLPILSDVELPDSHTHTRENKEPSIPPRKRHKTQPATDMSSIHPTETANCGDRANRILPVDKATDNSDVIKTAAECMPNNLDTSQAREQASQSTGDAADTAVVTTGHAGRPHPICAG